MTPDALTPAVESDGTTVWRPEGTSRGTVVVVTGRGEHPGVYGRLGRRLAFDGYTVVVPAAGEIVPVDDGAWFLLGSDSGAVRAWSFALAAGPGPDGLVLCGLPLVTTAPPVDRTAELAARTACPVHRALLDDDPGFRWGELAEPVPVAPARLPDLPVLIVHGQVDQVAPVGPVRALAAGHAQVELAVVRDGVHDVLNDQFHRIVAARIVAFLERVTRGAGFVPEQVVDQPVRARRSALLQVSARLDYAMRAMAELAAAGPATVTCEAMARSRDIPLNSLVNIMLTLRRAGLVDSRRGCEGGYRLARPASAITVADVVRATEGGIATGCADGPAAAMWIDLERTVTDLLRDRTLLSMTSNGVHS